MNATQFVGGAMNGWSVSVPEDQRVFTVRVMTDGTWRPSSLADCCENDEIEAMTGRVTCHRRFPCGRRERYTRFVFEIDNGERVRRVDVFGMQHMNRLDVLRNLIEVHEGDMP